MAQTMCTYILSLRQGAEASQRDASKLGSGQTVKNSLIVAQVGSAQERYANLWCGWLAVV